MICGSCLNDNAVAGAMSRLGHDVALLPTYTPMRTDAPGVARERVFYGAVRVYLRQLPLLRSAPRWLARLLDHPRVLAAAGKRSGATDASELGALTLSMLRGEEGNQRAELEELAAWLGGDFRPEVVHLTNSLFLGMARRLGEATGAPVVCSLQGEDLFVDGLPPRDREAVLAQMRRRARDTAVFVAPGEAYARRMRALLEVPAEKVRTVPLGISLAGFEPAPPRAASAPATVGYLARIAPEKGLHLLVEAFAMARERLVADGVRVRLRAAGWLGAKDRPYLDGIVRDAAARGLGDDFRYEGELDRDAKLRFLRELDVLSVPAVYPEAKGIPVLEALASGVPVVQPRSGSFPELVEGTGGGLLVEPESASALADGLVALLRDPQRRRELGARGREAVRRDHSDEAAARRTLALYAEVVASRGAGAAAAAASTATAVR